MSHGNALSIQGAGSRFPSPDKGASGFMFWKGSVLPSSNLTLTPSVWPKPMISLAPGQGA